MKLHSCFISIICDFILLCFYFYVDLHVFMFIYIVILNDFILECMYIPSAALLGLLEAATGSWDYSNINHKLELGLCFHSHINRR